MQLVSSKFAVLGFCLFALSGCSGLENPFNSGEYGTYEEFEEVLVDTYSRKPSPYSRAVRHMKRGPVDSWLATIHGYPDNLSVCEQLVEPYNNDPALSVLPGTYYCDVID